MEDLKQYSIGWIGTGVMGFHMCKHVILSKIFKNVYIYNRTQKPETTETLLKLSSPTTKIEWCNSPKQITEKSDIIISIVGYPKDVKQITFGEKGILEGLKQLKQQQNDSKSDKKKSKIYIDMTTSEPNLAIKIYDEFEKYGVDCLDCPVSGGDIGAKKGILMCMCGGKKQIFEKIKPLFECFGKNIFYMGQKGAGQHTKCSNQLFIATKMIGVVEGIIYAQKSGLDPIKVIEACSKGAAQSFSLSYYGPKMLKRDFNPGFYIEHFVKDMNIIISECEKMKLKLPGLELAKKFYEELQNQGKGKLGTQALLLAIEKINGIKYN